MSKFKAPALLARLPSPEGEANGGQASESVAGRQNHSAKLENFLGFKALSFGFAL